MEDQKKNSLLDDDLSLEELAKNFDNIDINDLEKIQDLAKLQQQMNDFLIDRFATNIEAFKKYMPDIGKFFEHYKPKRTIEFFCMPNGIPNLYFPDTNDFFYKTADPFKLCEQQIVQILERSNILQTRYGHESDPYGQLHFKYLNTLVTLGEEIERDRTLSPLKIGSVPNCMFFGIGLGYSLAYLYERVEVANLIIVEPDLDVFYASLHAFDWQNLLKFLFENKYAINIMLGQTPFLFTQDLSNFYSKHGRFLSSSWLGIVHYASPEIKAIADVAMRDLDSVHAAMGFFDDHLFGASHACHALLDKKNFVLRHQTLDKKYSKLPVFVIGSGPSLDNDIPFIRKNQDKAIIVACGTAIDTLYHAGIKPDFYACTERTPEIREALGVIPDEHFLDDVILLTGDVIHPYTTALFKHTAIFGKIDEPFYKYALATIKETRKVGFVQLMNPLVGNMGVSGALFLGFKNIYMFGLDNGKKIDSSAMHSKYTTLYNEHGCSDQGGSYTTKQQGKGNFGGLVETGYFFALSARNMGYVIRNLEEERGKLNCINCSDGLYVENTTPMHSYDLDFKKFKNIDKEDFHKYINEVKTSPVKVTRKELEEIFNPEVFKEIVNKVIEKLKARPKTRLETILMMQDISEFLCGIELQPQLYFYGSSLQGSLQTYFIVASRVLYNSSDEKQCLEQCFKMFEVISEFLEEAQTIFKHMPDFVIGEHRKFYPDGKVGIDYPLCKAPVLPPEFHLRRAEYDDPQKIFEKRYE